MDSHILLIRITATQEEIFDFALATKIKAIAPGVSFYDLDNHSDSLNFSLAEQLISTPGRLLCIIAAESEKEPLGKIPSLVMKLSRQDQESNSLILLGNHAMFDKFFRLVKNSRQIALAELETRVTDWVKLS